MDQSNRPSPLIHSLPPELISYILHYSLSSEAENPWDSYYSQLHWLRAVCLRWWELIDHTPSFWRYVYCWMTQGQLNKVLHHSKEGYLDYQCHCWERGNNGGDGSCPMNPESNASNPGTDLLGAATHCRRWESLTVGQTVDLIILKYLQMPLPSLIRLDVNASSISRMRKVYDEGTDGPLFGGERPRLLELSLDQYRLPLEVLALDRLRSFRAVDGYDITTITRVEVLNLLSTAPLLESLSFSEYRDLRSYLDGLGDDDAEASNFMPPQPPRAIKKMELHCGSPIFVDNIFRSVIPHPSGVEHVNVNLRAQPNSKGDPACLTSIGRFLGALRQPTDTFQFSSPRRNTPGSLSFSLGSVHVSLEYGWFQKGHTSMVNAVFAKCIREIGSEERHVVKTAHLELGNEEGLFLAILDQINEVFPNIAHCKLVGLYTEMMVEALQRLGTPETPLLPSLTELDIETNDDTITDEATDILEACLRARPSIIKWSLGTARCNDEQHERLRKIVPPGNLNLNDPQLLARLQQKAAGHGRSWCGTGRMRRSGNT